MVEQQSYRVAIDILCCHLGMSFDEACAELGLVAEPSLTSDLADAQATSISDNN